MTTKPPLADPPVRTLALFNNKSGVGRTTLTFNLAHMFARQGRRVALIDYDPQCDLTALALVEDDREACWGATTPGSTVANCIEPVRLGEGDLQDPQLLEIADGLYLLPGDIHLGRFELRLAREWPRLLTGEPEARARASHVTTALDRLAMRVAEVAGAELVLFDVGPSLGALNRAVILAADAIVIPVAPDLLSLGGLQNVGAALQDWRDDWREVGRVAHERRASDAPHLPERPVQPLGYIVQQHVVHHDRPVKASQRRLQEIPRRFARDVLMDDAEDRIPRDVHGDPRCLGFLKNFASLVPLAQEARKPLFELKHADGVLGSQFQTVASADKAFAALATAIGARLDALDRITV